MKFEEKIVDRQVGRNADLFARTIGEMPTIEERYPYIRILVSIVEQAHPEWNQAPTRDSRIALLIFHMSKGAINKDETAEIVRLRDEERGFSYIEKEKKAAKQAESTADASEKKTEGADGDTKEGVDSAADAESTRATGTKAASDGGSSAEPDEQAGSEKPDEQADSEKPDENTSKSSDESTPDDSKS